ncbi:MAG: hypothetical protein ACRD1L_13390, partial [Terriglobales bacterium]
LNQAPVTVVGVAARGFVGMIAGIATDFWAPITMADRLGTPGLLEDRTNHASLAVGRLRPGVTLASASAELDCLRSLGHARAIDPGFDVQHTLNAQIGPESLGHAGDAAHQFLEQVRTAIGALPGVRAASYITYPPLQGQVDITDVLAPGIAPPKERRASRWTPPRSAPITSAPPVPGCFRGATSPWQRPPPARPRAW